MTGKQDRIRIGIDTCHYEMESEKGERGKGGKGWIGKSGFEFTWSRSSTKLQTLLASEQWAA